MALAEVMDPMRESLQRSLDELISPRSSSRSKMKALQNLERDLATACFDTATDAQAKAAFMALQYTFECNVPAHLLSWIMATTARLESVLSKGLVDDGRGSEADELVAQLALSLSLIQGVTLNHQASKHYLGRRSALEILLDLLLASRHVGASSSQPSDAAQGLTTPTPLTSIVLDTLLCILVDSSIALRAFEEANGVQSIVKILKRAGTPREVRMKCLEFLYFYLLDETPNLNALASAQPTPPPTAPATPARGSAKPYLSATPMRPSSSRYGSSTFSFSSSTTTTTTTTAALSTSTSSSRSTSGSSSSNNSFCSTASNASSATTAPSTPASPEKTSTSGRPSPVKTSNSSSSSSSSSSTAAGASALLPKLSSKSPAKRMLTPITNRQPASPTSPPPTSPPSLSLSSSSSPPAAGAASGRFPQLRSMMMLRKEVDYVPQSPKKPLVGCGGGPGLAPKQHRKSLSMSAAAASSLQLRPRSALGGGSGNGSPSRSQEEEGRSLAMAMAMDSGVLRSPPPPPSQRHHHHHASMSVNMNMNANANTTSYNKPEISGRRSSEREKEREREREDRRWREHGREGDWKTTEEKKELLGTMLGNVDALVEGVRKAGIWGLG